MIMDSIFRCSVCALVITNFYTVSAMAQANEPVAKLADVTVTSTREDLQGIATSASEGVVTAKQLRTRPTQRAGDLMELVPGLVATQHSGEGKANQYFLRGFNLDHGTDLSTFVDGVPINMPTHGHGQGYTDLYFLIPELVDSVAYRKGPYYAQEGDFATAGSVRMRTIKRVASPSLLLESGSFGYRRLLALGSVNFGPGHWLGAVEKVADDGPWTVKQNLHKFNFATKYSAGTDSDGWAIGLNHYESNWIATDQIPDRAIGQIINGRTFTRYDSLDPTNGGITKRDALNANWALTNDDQQIRANVYAIKYHFNLYSNFTYFANGCSQNPLPSQCDGAAALDQFEQIDRRTVIGLNLSHSAPLTKPFTKLGAQEASLIVGFDLRRDSIAQVGLFDTTARIRTNTVRSDQANINAIGLWTQGQWQWTEQFRTTAGVRWDQHQFKVNSSIAQNSGSRRASIASPKFSAVYSPNKQTDWYANWGQGFHSNDARGTVIKIDPRATAQSVSAATPLVKGTGFEFGTRQRLNDSLWITAAAWQLKLDSELVFIGDAGTTEPSRPSTRRGIELTANWQVSKALQIDADASWTRSRFNDNKIDNDSPGPYLPGAMRRVVSLGASFQEGPWTIGAKLRSFGSRPLIEDNSIQGKPSTLANIKAGYRLNPNLELSAEIFNLFNQQTNDIEYAYASRLPGEAAFSEASTEITKHSHPSQPRTVRLGLKLSF